MNGARRVMKRQISAMMPSESAQRNIFSAAAPRDERRDGRHDEVHPDDARLAAPQVKHHCEQHDRHQPKRRQRCEVWSDAGEPRQDDAQRAGQFGETDETRQRYGRSSAHGALLAASSIGSRP